MAAGDQKADLGLWAGPWPCQWRFGPFIGGDGRAIRWIRHHGVGRFNRVTRRRMPAGTALLCSRAPCTSFPSPLSSLAHAERTRHGETRDSAGDHIACPGVRQNTRPRQSRTVLTGASACRSGPLSPSGRPQILHPTAGSRLSKDDVCIPTVLSFAVEMGPRPERTGIYTLGQGPPPSFSPTNTMSSSNEPSQINGKLHQYVSRTRSFLVSDPLQA